MSLSSSILICLQYRGKLSLGEDRQRLGFAAFHWSIIIHKEKYHRFDVTDGIVQDSITYEDTNPNRDWIYRHIECDALNDIPRYLAAVRVGRLRSTMDIADVTALIEQIPLPLKNAKPEGNCVSWTMDVVKALQKGRVIDDFDVQSCMRYVLAHGDTRIQDPTKVSDVIEYPPVSDAIAGSKRGFRDMLRRIGF